MPAIGFRPDLLPGPPVTPRVKEAKSWLWQLQGRLQSGVNGLERIEVRNSIRFWSGMLKRAVRDAAKATK